MGSLLPFFGRWFWLDVHYLQVRHRFKQLPLPNRAKPPCLVRDSLHLGGEARPPYAERTSHDILGGF